jgi:hypothetical protein
VHLEHFLDLPLLDLRHLAHFLALVHLEHFLDLPFLDFLPPALTFRLGGVAAGVAAGVAGAAAAGVASAGSGFESKYFINPVNASEAALEALAA